MDIASLIGFVGAVGMIAGAMITSGGIGAFIDTPSLLIVIGGTFFAVMYTSPLPVFLGSFGVMAKAFLPPIKKMDELVERMVELAGIARKERTGFKLSNSGQPELIRDSLARDLRRLRPSRDLRLVTFGRLPAPRFRTSPTEPVSESSSCISAC